MGNVQNIFYVVQYIYKTLLLNFSMRFYVLKDKEKCTYRTGKK